MKEKRGKTGIVLIGIAGVGVGLLLVYLASVWTDFVESTRTYEYVESRLEALSDSVEEIKYTEELWMCDGEASYRIEIGEIDNCRTVRIKN